MPDDSDRTAARDDPPAEFFMAVEASPVARSLYRVYPDGDALLFIRIGLFVPTIGVDIGRTSHGRHWLAVAGDAVRSARPFLAVAAVFLGLFVVIAFLRSFRGKEAEEVLIGCVVAVVTAVLTFTLLALTLVRPPSRRAARLDAMTADELSAEAEGGRNLVLVADDIAEATLKTARNMGYQKKSEYAPAWLILTLHPKGTRTLWLQHHSDVTAAARALRRLIGKQNVTVDLPLKGRR